MGMVYKAREGSRMTDDQAARYGPVLTTMSREGILKPSNVVEAAKPEESPLHDWYTWDDRSAATAHRLWQARTMLNSIVTIIDIDGRHEETRAFHVVTIIDADGDEEQGYASLPTILRDDAMRQQVVDNALRELETWQERYAQYSELFGAARLVNQGIREGRKIAADAGAGTRKKAKAK
jgi:hypothetical protein